MRRKKKLHRATRKMRGMTQLRTSPTHRLGISPVYLIPLFSSSSRSFGSSIRTALNGRGLAASFRVPWTRSCATATSWTLPSRTYCLNVLYGIVSPDWSEKKNACARASSRRIPRTYHIVDPGPVRGGSRRSPARRLFAGLGVSSAIS
jgi:hypothetical protein